MAMACGEEDSRAMGVCVEAGNWPEGVRRRHLVYDHHSNQHARAGAAILFGVSTATRAGRPGRPGAMAGAGRLEELELSAEEAERLQQAFRDEQFRALFAEYAAELADPEQRKLYEEEVAALERERGMEVRFVHPEAGYVLRTSQAAPRRCYLNVCSNPQIGVPQARPEPGGHRWALPYSLAPGREELGRGGRRRLVYDVVFHPAALRLAARSSRFRRLLSDTALDAVERHCGVQLDRANATVLRGTKYKGVPQAPVIRTPLPGGPPPPPDDNDSPLPPFPFPPAAPPPPPPPPAAAASSAARPAGPTTPRWSIRHRSYVDLQDYRCCRDSAPSPVPRELVVTVELPLLSSAAQAALEIRGRELRLDSQRPAYRLRLRLPYDVDENGGRAAFNKAQRQLLVTLPVVPPPAPQEPPGPAEERLLEEGEEEEAEPGAEGAAEAGGGAASPTPSADPEPSVPGGLGSAPCPPPRGNSPDEMVVPRGSDSPEAAVCPPFQCRQDEASLTLLLHVPGILPHSLSGAVGTSHYSLRFSSDTGTYALFLQFPPANRLVSPETSVSVSAHNAAIGLAKAPGCTGPWEKFCFGLDASALQERLFVSEENVDGFLGTVLCPSFCSQSAPESQPLIEVLDVTEDRIQIRLKPQEAAPSGGDGGEETPGSSGEDLAEKTNGDHPQMKAETNGAVADTAEREHATETNKTSTSSATAQTIQVGCSSHHCSQPEPSDAASAIPGEGRGEELDSESAVAAGEGGEGPGGDEGRAASPVLREVNSRDGSVRIVRDHVTRCPLAFQSSLLYELD
ncbi:PREDICTED: protein kintoun [Calidris pugnax]|uniref:protein kintoun n=1 Tax=Calidris pugnax TaxID=198806 RepID=UPI00071D5E43|nr:PREDICTED: protein kintoun [Calidris pugnax]